MHCAIRSSAASSLTIRRHRSQLLLYRVNAGIFLTPENFRKKKNYLYYLSPQSSQVL